MYRRTIFSILIFSFFTAVSLPVRNQKPQVWIVTWTTSQQIPDPHNALSADDLRDATVRQIFHLSAGGPALRVHISNAFGTEALHFTAVHIAKPLNPASPAIDPVTDKTLTFAGLPDLTIPPAAEFISDPIEYPVAALSDVAVTFHLAIPPATETGHPGSRAGEIAKALGVPLARVSSHLYRGKQTRFASRPDGWHLRESDESTPGDEARRRWGGGER